MYTLLSASVLAIDLARHPSGAAVADVVDRILSLSRDQVERLGEPAAADVRQRVLATLSDSPRMSTLMDGVAPTVAEGLPNARERRTLLAALSETLIGGLDDLHGLLTREQPLYGTRRAQTALDAVTVAWAGRHADLADLAALRRPWVDSTDPVPPALPEAPHVSALRALLDDVGRRTPDQWRRVTDAHAARRGRFAWSTPMHRACRAAADADRLIEVARAQLAAARALRLCGASTGPDAHAVAMAVTAAVQATCTRDLIDADVADVLLTPWRAGS